MDIWSSNSSVPESRELLVEYRQTPNDFESTVSMRMYTDKHFEVLKKV